MLTDQFKCGNNVYTMDECIKNQTPLTYYDPFAQIALQRPLREGTIMCYWQTGVEGLFSQMQAAIGQDKRTVMANPFYWTEQCNDFVITTTFKKSTDAVPAAGAPVSVIIDGRSTSRNSAFALTKGGYRGYIKELKGKGVNVISVTRSVTGVFTMILKPINGEVLDLTKFNTYTVLINPMRYYIKGTDDCITSEGMIQEPPTLRKGYLQQFEKSYCVHQDELNNYGYDVEFRIYKGIDQKTGKMIDYWSIPTLTNKLLVDWIDQRNIETLFGRRDDVKREGFDGLIPTADTQGTWTRRYDPSSGTSLKAMLMNMIRGLRKISGCNEYMLLHDFNFGLDWSDAISQFIKDYIGSPLTYSFFGAGGEGARNFTNFSFKDFESNGYKFRTNQIDMFDAQRYGSFLEYFALMMPACTFKDTNGKAVSPFTYVSIAGSEAAPQGKIWSDDTRLRGCRVVKVFATDTWGAEIHCASHLGVMRRSAC